MLSAISMYLGLVFLATWIPARWRRRAVGFGFWTDVTVHVTLQVMFGGDAGGRAAMVVAGLLVNLTMHAYRWGWGYETLTRRGWVRYAGRFTGVADRILPPSI